MERFILIKNFLGKDRLRYLLLFFLGFFSFHLSSAVDFQYPRDLPTFEALMRLHKDVKGAEDEAMRNIIQSMGEQSLIAKGSKLVNDTRATFDTKLSNVYSYILLANALSASGLSLYKLIDEYADFTSNVYKYASEKPYVMWYWTNANVSIYREVKHSKKLFAIFAASETSIWRASMADKVNMLFSLQAAIDRARAIIRNATMYCKLMINSDWKPDYIWDILTSDVKNEIVESIISGWNKN